MSVERELVDGSNFKPRRMYPDRQDYLAALARAVDGMSKENFNELSNEAADWFNDACEALNAKGDIPDFVDEEVEPTPDEPEEDNEAEEAEGDVDTEDDTEAKEGVSEGGDAIADEPPVPAGRKPGRPSKAAKAAAESKKDVPEKDPATRRVAHSPRTSPPPRKLRHKKTEILSDLTPEQAIIFDRFGVAKGTKNAAALALLEKGCRMTDVNESLGGTYYNLLKRLIKEGHHVERLANGFIQLYHKVDWEKKKASKKKLN